MSASTCWRRPGSSRCPRNPRFARRSSARSSAPTIAFRRSISRACRGSSSPATCTDRLGTARFRPSSRRTGTGPRAPREYGDDVRPGAGDRARASGLRRLQLRHGGYNDSQQLPHTFGGRTEHLWGFSLAGLQLWNGIRALDFSSRCPTFVATRPQRPVSLVADRRHSSSPRSICASRWQFPST